MNYDKIIIGAGIYGHKNEKKEYSSLGRYFQKFKLIYLFSGEEHFHKAYAVAANQQK